MSEVNIELQNLGESIQAPPIYQPMEVTYLKLIKLTFPFCFDDIQPFSNSRFTKFREVFVVNNHLVTEAQFEQTITLVQAIPGATIPQLLVALGTIAKKNAFGGIVALLTLSVPTAIILLLLGTIYQHYPEPKDQHWLVILALQGIKSSTVALILQLCIQLAMKQITGYMHGLIAIVSGIAILYLQSGTALVIIMVMGGIVLLMIEYDSENTSGRRTIQMTLKPTINEENNLKYITQKNANIYSILLGNKSLHLYVLILIGLLYLNTTMYSLIYDISLTFYKIGTIMIGGTPIILPFMYAETVVNPLYVNSDPFWIGFALAAALPGPYLNFTIFLGAQAMGPLGGICCWVAVYVPSVLQIWGLLPHWNTLRSNSYFNKFKDGLVCSAVGFLAICAYHCWVAACLIDAQTATIISFLSLVYLILLNFNCPGVMALGAALFIVRYLALWYYRDLKDVQVI